MSSIDYINQYFMKNEYNIMIYKIILNLLFNVDDSSLTITIFCIWMKGDTKQKSTAKINQYRLIHIQAF